MKGEKIMYESDLPEQYSLLTPEEQAILCSWIKENFFPIKSFTCDCTSYGLKHVFENSPNGFYISNGMFKQAMKVCGFKVKNESETNWTFNISRKSPGVPNPLKGKNWPM
jgi:hypothetical protein